MFLHIWVVLFILLNSVPLYEWTTVCLPVHQLLDHWVLSRFLLWKNCSKHSYKVFVWTYVFISLEEKKWWKMMEKKRKTKWLSCGKCILNFIRKWQIVSAKWLYHFAFPTKCIHTKTLCVCLCLCAVAQLCLTLWFHGSCQAPLSMKFYNQEYWSG